MPSQGSFTLQFLLHLWDRHNENSMGSGRLRKRLVTTKKGLNTGYKPITWYSTHLPNVRWSSQCKCHPACHFRILDVMHYVTLWKKPLHFSDPNDKSMFDEVTLFYIIIISLLVAWNCNLSQGTMRFSKFKRVSRCWPDLFYLLIQPVMSATERKPPATITWFDLYDWNMQPELILLG